MCPLIISFKLLVNKKITCRHNLLLDNFTTMSRVTLRHSHRTYHNYLNSGVIMHALDNPGSYITLGILMKSSVYSEVPHNKHNTSPAIVCVQRAFKCRLEYCFESFKGRLVYYFGSCKCITTRCVSYTFWWLCWWRSCCWPRSTVVLPESRGRNMSRNAPGACWSCAATRQSPIES